jgi:Ni/Fe-hydrogenase subunit HybB-like protein
VNKIIRFVIDYVAYVAKGGPRFYAAVGVLAAFSGLWLICFAVQSIEGLQVTGLTSQVSDGLYIGNFAFLVGVAAAAVTVVFPAYVYHHKALHEVAVLGEMVAVSAVIMALLFVMSHLGRPDRVWHMMPPIGILNFPDAMLAFDAIVLTVYLILNAVCGFYFLFTKFAGTRVDNRIFKPLVYLSIVWALSIHTVTAFLFNTMVSRPFWHHSMMPIHFITTAFAAGPALIISMFLIIRKHTRLPIADEAIDLLSHIVTYCLGIALFLLLSEVVTELYHPTEHVLGLEYLMFGVNGLNALVPWFWASVVAIVVAFVMLLVPSVRKNYRLLPVACGLAFAGIWVQKGIGLLVPGYDPSPIGEFTNYSPTLLEIGIVLGNWGTGILILTILAKGAVGILLGEVKWTGDTARVLRDASPIYRGSMEPPRLSPWASLKSAGLSVDPLGGSARTDSAVRRRGRAAAG